MEPTRIGAGTLPALRIRLQLRAEMPNIRPASAAPTAIGAGAFDGKGVLWFMWSIRAQRR